MGSCSSVGLAPWGVPPPGSCSSVGMGCPSSSSPASGSSRSSTTQQKLHRKLCFDSTEHQTVCAFNQGTIYDRQASCIAKNTLSQANRPSILSMTCAALAAKSCLQ